MSTSMSFSDLFASKPESLTHDKARAIIRETRSLVFDSFKDQMTDEEINWTNKAFAAKGSPFNYFNDLIRALAVGDQLYNNCANCLPPDWSKFEGLQFGGCIYDPNDGVTIIGGKSDDEAQFWTIYGRCPDGDAEAITDCATLPDAVMVAHRLAAISRLSCESSGFDMIEPGDPAPASIEEAKAWMAEHAWTETKSEPGPSL